MTQTLNTLDRTVQPLSPRLLLAALLILLPLTLLLSTTAIAAEPTTAEPTAAEPTADTGTAAADKEAPPAPGKPKGFELPAKHTFELDNGLRATLVQYGLLPKATISARLRLGNGNETAEEVWLADLTVDLMGEGTTTRDAKTLAAEAATMGGELDLNVGNDSTAIGANVLAEFAPQAVRLVADVMRNPAFPPSEVERLKSNMIRDVTIALSQPQPIAQQRLASVIYGDHPYGRLFPTTELIQSYSVEKIRRFYEANFGARRTHIYVVGKFDPAAVETAIRESFDDWTAGAEPISNPPKMTSERKVHLIDRPGAQQSTVRIAIPTIDPSHADFTALQIANALLGGSFNSRITANIREDKGYTYSPNSAITSNYRTGLWTQTADITTNVTGPALREIFKEIDRMRAEAPSAEELRGIQNYLAGVFVLRNSIAPGIIGQLARIELHGLSDDYLNSYVDQIYAVTPERVREVVTQYLRPDEMTLVVAGDRATIAEQLAEFGEIVD